MIRLTIPANAMRSLNADTRAAICAAAREDSVLPPIFLRTVEVRENYDLLLPVASTRSVDLASTPPFTPIREMAPGDPALHAAMMVATDEDIDDILCEIVQKHAGDAEAEYCNYHAAIAPHGMLLHLENPVSFMHGQVAGQGEDDDDEPPQWAAEMTFFLAIDAEASAHERVRTMAALMGYLDHLQSTAEAREELDSILFKPEGQEDIGPVRLELVA